MACSYYEITLLLCCGRGLQGMEPFCKKKKKINSFYLDLLYSPDLPPISGNFVDSRVDYSDVAVCRALISTNA